MSIFAAGDGRSKKSVAIGWLSLLVTDLRQEQREAEAERGQAHLISGLTLISFGEVDNINSKVFLTVDF